jgi:hypothetical protein
LIASLHEDMAEERLLLFNNPGMKCSSFVSQNNQHLFHTKSP